VLAAAFALPLPGRVPGRAKLVSEAQTLSAEILTWLGERKHDEPDHDFTRDFEDESRRSIGHARTTMATYMARFHARSLSVYDRLIKIGASQVGDRFHIEHPTNPLGIAKVVHVLSKMATSVQK